jgi:integrase
MTKKRDYGSGAIEPRGNSWRLRYRIGGKVFRKTLKDTTKSEAQKALRQLLHAGDEGTHVAPDKLTLRSWAEHWLSIGAPGSKNRRPIGQRALERYEQLLRCHVLPVLGDRPLQMIQASEIDKLYAGLDEQLSAGSKRFVHLVLASCLGTATRTRKITRNPMLDLAKAPPPAEADHGMVLEASQLAVLIGGFKGLALFPIVATAAFTGARRSEILALRWADLDAVNKTLRIERAIEETAEHGLQIKGPKTERGKRTITIDDDLLALLMAEREKHRRVVAGVPDGAAVDLSLVKLPDGALIFPNPPAPGEDFSFIKLRKPSVVTKAFASKATALGFPGLRFHDLRGAHETMLLDRGIGVHTVAARCGHDPAVLLHSYAKRTKKADTAAAEVIGELAKGILGN